MSHFDYLTPDQKFLADAVFQHFKSKYGSLSVKRDCGIHADLQWQPTFFFKKNKYEIIACEISEEKIYPQIFRLIHTDITAIPVTIHCYAICPQSVCLNANNQKEFAELKKHGHGLLSVELDGSVLERSNAIPAIFHIPEVSFKNDLIKGYSGRTKAAVVNAFDTYKNDPLSGVRELCDNIELIINKACTACNEKKGMSIKPKDTIHKKLNAMLAEEKLHSAASSIGAVMGYYSRTRNSANHAPRSAKQAHKKYGQCKENFVNGVRNLEDFISQFKSLGIKLSV